MNKSIIAWVGGKSKLMWLINLLAPTRYERSIDVFGGSGTVTLNLEQSCESMKVYNDYNKDLVNLMRCARDKPLALIREIGFLALNARDDFEVCKKIIQKEEFTDRDLLEELELTNILFPPMEAEELRKIIIHQNDENDVKRAATYFKLLRYSFNANGETFGGRKCDVRRFYLDIWNFSRAFAFVTIENKDFESLIKQYDRENAFIYCDPPYFEAEGFYTVGFQREDHTRLRDVLLEVKGYVMVSYNHVPEILELYEKFYIFLTLRPHSMSKKENEMYEELIITNYNPFQHIQKKTMQMHLFHDYLDGTEEGEYQLIHEPVNTMKE